MIEFTRDSILKAIEKIDQEPELKKDRSSFKYDLVYDGKTYPPILVLSEASKILGGDELFLTDFRSAPEAFEVFKGLGFTVKDKKDLISDLDVRIWIEKTHVAGRKDRIEGDYAIGKRLWSPTRDKRGGDIYSLMRKVSENDIVLHLTDNIGFTGISKVKSKYYEGQGVPGSEWEGEAYIIELEDFTRINTLPRNAVLKEENRTILESIKSKHRVFYNSELNLNQGAYLTECPRELADLINSSYYEANGYFIPLLPTPKPALEIPPENKSPKMFDIKEFTSSIRNANIFFNDRVVSRFICALLTKPFVILTGLSGSGKTKLAQAFSKWITEDESQICIVPVGADWTNREPLLGYPNALESGKYISPDSGVLDLLLEANKSENASKPYFLILDEMNLSHVERYFADFLSAMESSEAIPLHNHTSEWKDNIPATIKLPSNLFLIGTVNIDETTYMFSPKVLDRANVIEFRITENEIKTFLTKGSQVNLDLLKSKGADSSKYFIELATNKNNRPSEPGELNKYLLSFFNELKTLGAEFGYRTASEIIRFAAIVNQVEPTWTINQITDAALMQKLLPKVHGSRRKLEPVLKALGALCLQEGQSIEEVLNQSTVMTTGDFSQHKFPISLEKISRMYTGLINNGFTSYAEA